VNSTQQEEAMTMITIIITFSILFTVQGNFKIKKSL